MSTKKQIRRERMRRAREEEKKRKRGMTPVKAALLFIVALFLMFAAMAIFDDSTRRADGRVWSPAHQHWH